MANLTQRDKMLAMCVGKVAYPTYAQAAAIFGTKSVLSQRIRRGDGRAVIYRCEICRHFHLAHRSKRRAK